MKNTLLSTFSLFAALATVFLFTANTAEARGHSHGTSTYVSHYSSCGCPVYVNKVFRGHDCYGRAVYSYYTQPVSHRCNRYNQHNNRHHQSSNRCGTTNSNYYRSSRGYRNGHSSYRSSHSGYTGRSGIRITYRR